MCNPQPRPRLDAADSRRAFLSIRWIREPENWMTEGKASGGKLLIFRRPLYGNTKSLYRLACCYPSLLSPSPFLGLTLARAQGFSSFVSADARLSFFQLCARTQKSER